MSCTGPTSVRSWPDAGVLISSAERRYGGVVSRVSLERWIGVHRPLVSETVARGASATTGRSRGFRTAPRSPRRSRRRSHRCSTRTPRWRYQRGSRSVLRAFHNKVRSGGRRTLSVWSGLRLRRSRSEEHTSELQSCQYLVCRLLLEKKTVIAHTGAPLVRALQARERSRLHYIP